MARGNPEAGWGNTSVSGFPLQRGYKTSRCHSTHAGPVGCSHTTRGGQSTELASSSRHWADSPLGRNHAWQCKSDASARDEGVVQALTLNAGSCRITVQPPQRSGTWLKIPAHVCLSVKKSDKAQLLAGAPTDMSPTQSRAEEPLRLPFFLRDRQSDGETPVTSTVLGGKRLPWAAAALGDAELGAGPRIFAPGETLGSLLSRGWLGAVAGLKPGCSARQPPPRRRAAGRGYRPHVRSASRGGEAWAAPEPAGSPASRFREAGPHLADPRHRAAAREYRVPPSAEAAAPARPRRAGKGEPGAAEAGAGSASCRAGAAAGAGEGPAGARCWEPGGRAGSGRAAPALRGQVQAAAGLLARQMRASGQPRGLACSRSALLRPQKVGRENI